MFNLNFLLQCDQNRNSNNNGRYGGLGNSNGFPVVESQRSDRNSPLSMNSGGNYPKKGLCVRGTTCSAMHTTCAFNHTPINKPCRNGPNCPNSKSTCLFSHGPEESVASQSNNRRGQFNNITDRDAEITIDRTWLRAKN